MTQDEFNNFVADEIIKLRDENKALKKQLKSFDNAEELLAKLTIASDQAKEFARLDDGRAQAFSRAEPAEPQAA